MGHPRSTVTLTANVLKCSGFTSHPVSLRSACHYFTHSTQIRKTPNIMCYCCTDWSGWMTDVATSTLLGSNDLMIQQVDILTWGGKAKRIHAQILDICAILSGKSRSKSLHCSLCCQSHGS